MNADARVIAHDRNTGGGPLGAGIAVGFGGGFGTGSAGGPVRPNDYSMTGQPDPIDMNRSAILTCCLLLGLTACSSTSADKAGQKSDGFPAPSKELVYRAALNTMRQSGFVPDAAESSITSGYATSRWNTSLQPFAGRGRRDKATIRIHEVPGRKGYYRVETNVTREYNMNVTEPSNPVAAQWKNSERVSDLENLMTRKIEMQFITMGPSAEFRSRYDLPEDKQRLRNLDPKEKDKNFLDGFMEGLTGDGG